jgi:hypothetical protein
VLFCVAREAAGASGAPAFPAPSLEERDNALAKSGQIMSRKCEASRADAREKNSKSGAAREGGWGTWIRTKTNRVRVCCATVTPFPNGLPSLINSLCGYPGKSHTAGAGQITARWWQRSTRLIPLLASAEAAAFCRPLVRKAGSPAPPRRAGAMCSSRVASAGGALLNISATHCSPKAQRQYPATND